MTEGIDYISIETHNWGKTVKFWQQLGFTVELDLGSSGRLTHPNNPTSLWIEEVAEDATPGMQIFLKASSSDQKPDSPVEVVKDWHDSHWGSKLMEVIDSDDRTITIQHRDD